VIWRGENGSGGSLTANWNSPEKVDTKSLFGLVSSFGESSRGRGVMALLLLKRYIQTMASSHPARRWEAF